jgi:hypothetical protein
MWTKKIPVIEGWYRIKDDAGCTAIVYVAPVGPPVKVDQDIWFWPIPIPDEEMIIILGEEVEA